MDKNVPVLNIKQFEHKIAAADFYSNCFEEHSKKNSKTIFKPHTHDFFLCVMFTAGSGVHEIDFNAYSIKSGSVFFLKPGQMHHWRFDSPPKGYIFFHSQEFYELCFLNTNLSQYPFFSSQETTPYIDLNASDIPKFERLFELVNQEYVKGGLYKYEKINSLINLIYIDLSRKYAIGNYRKEITSKTYLNILEKFQDTLEQYFAYEKSPSFYAEKLNITTKHLNRVVKVTLDKTCSVIIKERVILEAKRLLVHSSNPLSTIGMKLGYEEYSYFSKIFKSYTGLTPFDFRKKY